MVYEVIRTPYSSSPLEERRHFHWLRCYSFWLALLVLLPASGFWLVLWALATQATDLSSTPLIRRRGVEGLLGIVLTVAALALARGAQKSSTKWLSLWTILTLFGLGAGWLWLIYRR